jgi:hypothetical protein
METAEEARASTWKELAEREPRLADVRAGAQVVVPMCKKEERRFDYAHAFSLLRRRFREPGDWKFARRRRKLGRRSTEPPLPGTPTGTKS